MALRRPHKGMKTGWCRERAATRVALSYNRFAPVFLNNCEGLVVHFRTDDGLGHLCMICGLSRRIGTIDLQDHFANRHLAGDTVQIHWPHLALFLLLAALVGCVLVDSEDKPVARMDQEHRLEPCPLTSPNVDVVRNGTHFNYVVRNGWHFDYGKGGLWTSRSTRGNRSIQRPRTRLSIPTVRCQ